ncbi:sensor histidine kinase [Microbulbifer sp. TYP-18]|uniref:sensor histidine kinase n=1 Tax=Microbulbifer sp. TYP-18 TaxID=3230024 RepID=UPI0034C6A114
MRQSALYTRLLKTIYLMVAITVLICVLAVELFFEDVESRALNFELQANADFFKANIEGNKFQHWKTADLEAFFLPQDGSDARLPELFRGREAPSFDEVKIDGKTFLITVEQVNTPSGKLYLAKDFTSMERREFIVEAFLVLFAAIMLVAGFFVSKGSARLLIKPLEKLSRDIRVVKPGVSMQRLKRDYRDIEFVRIAESFNLFLSELEFHIKREKAFVKLASHELRTPLAVISGALEILEQRRDLTEKDQKTLSRIGNATRTMQQDTEMLLQLARGKADDENLTQVNVPRLAEEVVADLGSSNRSFANRAEIISEASVPRIYTNPVLVRMLLRNLIKNALVHTPSKVEIHLDEEQIHINDFGGGLPPPIVSKVTSSSYKESGGLQESSFGLLIVQLICERLNWQLEIAQSSKRGTRFVIHMNRPLQE